MRILLLDIETAPNLAYVWGTWKQNINPEWIAANGYVLCWAAKWYKEPEIFFRRLHPGKPISLLEPIHRLLDKADAVVHYNGTKFDIPTLNKEFITHRMVPPSPYKQIDLLRTMRERFRFPSNKLDYVAQVLSVGEKLRHAGTELWLGCMANKRASWEQMEAYNKKDVLLLEPLYERLLPWIPGHPNRATHDDVRACPKCRSENFVGRGLYTLQVGVYKRYACKDCGSWFRGNKSVRHLRGERMVNAV